MTIKHVMRASRLIATLRGVRPVRGSYVFATIAMLLVSGAMAASETSARFQLSMPGQPLDAALTELARRSGTQLVYRSRLVKGREAPPLEGSYTIAAALDAMLAGSDLTYRVLNDNTIEVRRARADDNRRRREALARAPASEGSSARGSDDPIEEVTVTATAQGVVAMRTETPLRQIPQTVSLVSPAQIRVQNLTTVDDALDRVPGLVFAYDSPSRKTFVSRGYPVTSFHVDGSASAFSYRTPHRKLPDLAEFERIEVLRGADGLFAGNGAPGASINLIRKRPQYEPALRVSSWGGSWDNYRVEVDATGPLAFEGALRGRMVGVYHDQDSFIDAYENKRKMLLGVLDYDVTPSTLVTLGLGYNWSEETPTLRSMPTAFGGVWLLPPNRNLSADWEILRNQSMETYLRLQQSLGENWRLQFGATRWDDRHERRNSAPSFIPNRSTRSIDMNLDAAVYTTQPNTPYQFTSDITVTGGFQAFGFDMQLALGADYGRYVAREHVGQSVFEQIKVDVRDYSPSLLPDPRFTEPLYRSKNDTRGVTESLGAFVAAKVFLTEPLSITLGARAGMERYRTSYVFTRSDGSKNFGGSDVSWSPTVVTPYGAVMYELNDNYSLYASYADIYRNHETDIYDNFDLDPRRGVRVRPDGSRIGVRHGVNIEAGIKAAWLDGSINGALTGYTDYQYRVPLAVSSTASVTGVSKSTGADLELSGAFGNWAFGGGYSFNENRPARGTYRGVRGPRYLVPKLSRDMPKHLLKLWVDKQLTGVMSRWTVGGDLRAQTAQTRVETVCRNPAPEPCGTLRDATFDHNEYAVLDLRASYQVAADWRVGLTVNNVLDKLYYESSGALWYGSWIGEPRNYLLKLEGTFGAAR